MAVRRIVAAGLGALLIGVLTPAPPTQAGAAGAGAAGLTIPNCPGNVAPRLVRGGIGILEAITADPRGGRLYMSDIWTGRRILRLDGPDEAPKVLLGNVDSPGGLSWQGNTMVAGLDVGVGLNPRLVRVDPDTGEWTPYAEGVGNNGVDVGPDGSVYSSTWFHAEVDRVAVDGTVTKGWASSTSTNGLAVDNAGKYLYVVQTVPAPAIHKIEIADPANVQEFARPPLLESLVAWDGLDIDSQDRLYVAGNTGGAYRIDTDGSICALARHPLLVGATQMTFGSGGDFPKTSGYVVTLTGNLVELPYAVR